MQEEETLEETSNAGPRANCPHCPKSFSRTDVLNRHIAKKHVDAVKLSDTFVNIKNNKWEADGSDASGKKYKCDKCEKSFLTGLKLKKHKKKHTGSGEHECEVCQKRFHSSSSLFLHRNIHLEEKPFKCDDCDKGFNQKGNLKAHLQKYHGKEMSAVLSENNVMVGEAETMEVEVDFPGAIEEEVEVDFPEAIEEEVELNEAKKSEVIGEIVSEVLE